MGRRFEGKVIWITGASSGIGEALAVAFAAEGASLVLTARREPELLRVAKRCHPAEVTIVPLDLADVPPLAAAVSAVLAKVGRVDVMVHNAGRSQRGLVADTSVDDDRAIMELNFFGVVALTKALLPSMLARGDGRFVVLSSLAGLLGTKMRSAYCASKHALEGFFASFDAELHERGIRVTMVNPGFVRTSIGENALRAGEAGHAAGNDAIEGGMPVERAAGIIVDAVARGADSVAPAGAEILGVYLKRISPALTRRLARRLNRT